MPKSLPFAQHFGINKTQAELDFVDINLRGDTRLYIDPYALGKRLDPWSIEASNLVVDFFETAIAAIRAGDHARGRAMLDQLGEPNDTALGQSRGNAPRGRGVSGQQSVNLYDKLKDSTAAKTGFLADLEDCELFVPGIGDDKISDITTNIIRLKLIEYTATQCELHGVPMQQVPSDRFWDDHVHEWNPGIYAPRPVYKSRRILLVPKAIARFALTYDYREYYQHYVLNYLQREAIAAGDSLVQVLKNGKRRVTKKSLKARHPLSKDFLYEFSKDQPEVLKDYRRNAGRNAGSDPSTVSGDDATALLALIPQLKAIPAGNDHATAYHNLMKGALEALFYPWLMHPRKEQELHEGRKRIDLAFTNAARTGFFNWLHATKKIPCPFILAECKNYKADPANPELDQLMGRFSPNRGQFGLLLARTCKDRALFRKRCKDTVTDAHGYIILLIDQDVEALLKLRAANQTKEMTEYLDAEFRHLVF